MIKRIQYFSFFLIMLWSLSLNAQKTTISFEYYQRLIFLKVKVNKMDSLLFLFDTGANASAIDTKTANVLKLTTLKMDSVEGSAGTIVVPHVKAKTVSVGKSLVKNIVFTKYDLSGSLAPPNQRLNGILGTDFLKNFVVAIDFQNKQITLSKKVVNKLQSSFPFEMENGIPRIKAKINNSVFTWFRYDSGSSLFDTKDIYINTTTPVFDLLAKADTTLKPVAYFSATGIGGSIKLPVYKINSVLLNAIEVHKPFIIVQPRQGYFARPDAVGFFGNNFLEKFQKVTIDFIDKKMYIFNSAL